MGKRKIALFFDEDTEDGKQILEFLTPFSKRKSDIVGELVLLWISEHGTNVPVQWLDRKAERKRGSSEFIKAFEVPSSCTFGNGETLLKVNGIFIRTDIYSELVKTGLCCRRI